MIPTLKAIDLASRDGLRRVFVQGAPTAAIKTGLILGHCEMLGAFLQIPPTDKPGWICKAWTRTNPRPRYLAVIVDNEAASHRVIEIPEVPWLQWDGGVVRGTFRPETLFWSLAWGDYPERNAIKFCEALRSSLSDEGPQPHDDTADPSDAAERSGKQGLFARIRKLLDVPTPKGMRRR